MENRVENSRLFKSATTILELLRTRGYNLAPSEELLYFTGEIQFEKYAMEILSNQRATEYSKSLMLVGDQKDAGSRSLIISTITEAFSNIYVHETIPGKKILVYFVTRGNASLIPTDAVRKLSLLLMKEETKVFPGQILSVDDLKQRENDRRRENNKPKITDLIIVTDAELGSDAKRVFQDITVAIYKQIYFQWELQYIAVNHRLVPYHQLLTSEEAENVARQYRTPISKFPIIKLVDPVVKWYGWPQKGVVKIYRRDLQINKISVITTAYKVII